MASFSVYRSSALRPPPAGIHPRDSSNPIVITPVLGLRTDSLGLGGYVPWPDIVGLDHRCDCLTWLTSVHRTWLPPLDAGRVPRLAVLTRDHDFALTIHPGSVARQAPDGTRHAANRPGSGIAGLRGNALEDRVTIDYPPSVGRAERRRVAGSGSGQDVRSVWRAARATDPDRHTERSHQCERQSAISRQTPPR